MSTVLHGSGVSDGLALGRVVLLRPAVEPVVPEPVPPERVHEEIGRFHDAREKARVELETLRDQTCALLGDNYAGILDAQLLILDDPKLVDRTVRQIRTGRVSASWALKEAVHEFLRKFEAIEDLYLRERGGDVQDVHHRLQRILRERSDPVTGFDLEGPVVVVAHSLGPSDSAYLAQREIAAFATDVGGRTSHTAILAQALSVPAVVGLRDITRRVRPGQAIIVDGRSGKVTLDPDPNEVSGIETAATRLERQQRALIGDTEAPLRTADGQGVELRANVEFAFEVERARRYGARGIGLYRSEFLFLQHSPRFPDEHEHYVNYLDIAREIAPHPVVVRTLDLGGEKYFHEFLGQGESNPVLGLRGVRLCLRRPDIFRPQIRGLLRAAAEHDIRVMIPLVTFVEEIREVRAFVAREAESLRAEGTACNGEVPLGIMVEVPAAALSADVLAREADFFSIGTNDLIQYVLAVDRANESLADLYRPLHPSILRMLRFVIESATNAGIPVAMCGEMAADPEMIEVLLGLGLRELSVQPRALGEVRAAIREIDTRVAEERAREAIGIARAHDPESSRSGGRG